jgi:hypothetical protein
MAASDVAELDLFVELLLPDAFPGARATKRRGRPKGRLGPTARAIRDAVLDGLVDRFERMTVRQAFYALEVAGVVEETEGGYRQVQQQLLRMRREGELPWGFITDGTRWQRKPTSWDRVEDYVDSVARTYRRDLWQSQGVRLEFWLEKDALADVVHDVTRRWDVALMVSRGQSSATFLHTAAKEAEAAYRRSGVATFIYALSDYDAGGARAAHTVEHELPQHAPGVPIHFERLAVTPKQIAEWGLPTRPAKKSDPQAAKWGRTPAVELDAINPNQLNKLIEDAIELHVDKRVWHLEREQEQRERQGLFDLRDGFRGAAKVLMAATKR